MKFETERLELIPLNVHELELWTSNIKQLEKELNCLYEAEPIEGEFLEIIKKQIEITLNDKENYIFHTFWLIIRKSDRVVIGSADFKDVPNKDGEVEIGYGQGKKFEHNGYITETVQEMCKYAFTLDNIKHVIAETELDGYASQRILKRCGFKEYKRDKTIWWKV